MQYWGITLSVSKVGRQRDREVGSLDPKSRSRGFQSFSNHELVVPSSTPPLHQLAHWPYTCQLKSGELSLYTVFTRISAALD